MPQQRGTRRQTQNVPQGRRRKLKAAGERRHQRQEQRGLPVDQVGVGQGLHRAPGVAGAQPVPRHAGGPGQGQQIPRHVPGKPRKAAQPNEDGPHQRHHRPGHRPPGHVLVKHHAAQRRHKQRLRAYQRHRGEGGRGVQGGHPGQVMQRQAQGRRQAPQPLPPGHLFHREDGRGLAAPAPQHHRGQQQKGKQHAQGGHRHRVGPRQQPALHQGAGVGHHHHAQKYQQVRGIHVRFILCVRFASPASPPPGSGPGP